MRRARSLPFRSARSMKSSQMDCPASCSRWRRLSVMVWVPARVVSRASRGRSTEYTRRRGSRRARRRRPRGRAGGGLLLSREPLAHHVSPAALSAQVLPERLQPEPHGHLPIAEVLEQGEPEHPQQVAEPAIAPEARLLEHDRPEREQRPVAERHAEEEEGELPVDAPDDDA